MSANNAAFNPLHKKIRTTNIKCIISESQMNLLKAKRDYTYKSVKNAISLQEHEIYRGIRKLRKVL